jgi:hypothetical protein
MGDPLAGYAILIVEPEIDPFVFNLQAALEGRGAETLAVHEPARAIERTREFRAPAAVIDCGYASQAPPTLINDLCDVPILLYGSEGLTVASTRKVPHLAFTHASAASLVSALDRPLQSARY